MLEYIIIINIYYKVLMTSWNKHDYNKWVKLGCPKNDNITTLYCHNNIINTLVGIKNLIM